MLDRWKKAEGDSVYCVTAYLFLINAISEVIPLHLFRYNPEQRISQVLYFKMCVCVCVCASHTLVK